MLLGGVCADDALDDGLLNGLRNFTPCSEDTHHLSSKLPSIIHENTMLTINLNFNEKLICSPAGNRNRQGES